jgi:hypothetical protein
MRWSERRLAATLRCQRTQSPVYARRPCCSRPLQSQLGSHPRNDCARDSLCDHGIATVTMRSQLDRVELAPGAGSPAMSTSSSGSLHNTSAMLEGGDGLLRVGAGGLDEIVDTRSGGRGQLGGVGVRKRRGGGRVGGGLLGSAYLSSNLGNPACAACAVWLTPESASPTWPNATMAS